MACLGFFDESTADGDDCQWMLVDEKCKRAENIGIY